MSDAARVAVLRGLANGSATATLLAPLPLPAAPEAAATEAAAAALEAEGAAAAEVEPAAPRRTTAGGGGGARSPGEAASRCPSPGEVAPRCLLFGELGSSVLAMCASCVVPAHKLGAFRALESLLAHLEAVAAPELGRKSADRNATLTKAAPEHARRGTRAADRSADGAGAQAGSAGLSLSITAGAAGAAGLTLTINAGEAGAAAGAAAGAVGEAGAAAGAASAAEASGHLDAFLGRTLQLLWDHWEVSFASLVVMFAPLQRRILAMVAALFLTFVSAEVITALGLGLANPNPNPNPSPNPNPNQAITAFEGENGPTTLKTIYGDEVTARLRVGVRGWA